MKTLDKKVAAGFSLAFAIIIGLGTVQYLTTRRLINDNRWVGHTNTVLLKLEVALSEVGDAQSAARGFVMTGDERYLVLYRNAASITRRKVNMLRQLTADNAEEQRRLSVLVPRVAEMLQEFAKAIELRQKQQLSAAEELILVGRGMMDADEVRAILGQMKETEFLLLKTRNEAAAASNKRTTSLILLGTIAALLLLAASGMVVAADLVKRKRAELELDRERGLMHALMENIPDVIYFKDRQSRLTRVNNGLLRKYGLSDPSEAVGKTVFDFFTSEYAQYAFESEQEVMRTGKPLIGVESRQTWPDRPDTWASVTKMPVYDQEGNITGIFGVARDITERKKAEEDLRRAKDALEVRVAERTAELAQLNKGLEQRVAERTTQLEEANRDLEAFTYSVAHDLRAPLRHIAGFAQILMDEQASKLDSDASRYLQRIYEGAGHMGRLVDDLLSLSRVGRQELALRSTSLKALVESVQAELAPECADREIEWAVGELPTVDCDPGLMKQVFVNLLANAVKYTRSRTPARIEIGVQESGSETVIFVRDNGVGFDMKYSKKLFGVFQRLHAAKDFEGTGVGLAIVQRILHKHGWRVWAEAELDQGASFYISFRAAERPGGGAFRGPMQGGKQCRL
ncbi:MAG TPA: CHASE3 domain-containing protein [Terriglobia bacterium]|nr:CHASE3 domain-containing protein [Terriglobia bacterium]